MDPRREAMDNSAEFKINAEKEHPLYAGKCQCEMCLRIPSGVNTYRGNDGKLYAYHYHLLPPGEFGYFNPKCQIHQFCRVTPNNPAIPITKDELNQAFGLPKDSCWMCMTGQPDIHSATRAARSMRGE